MKFNEPVRPAGIGRKQVAFDIGQKPSLFNLIENADNDGNDTNSQTGQDDAVLAQANASARVIAYSAASSAIDNNMNEVWGIKTIVPWTHTLNSSHLGNSLIKWESDPRNEAYGINTSLAYIDTSDPTIIRVRKKGWYLVNVIFLQTEWHHNNSIYYLRALAVDQPDSFYTMQDVCITDTYPVLRLSTLIGVPSGNNLGKPSTTTDGGIQIEFRSQNPGHGAEVYELDDDNVEAQLQIIWLRPFEDENTYNFA
jgi:hypothetical protein